MQVAPVSGGGNWVAVVDSGSPITVADPAAVRTAGIDLESVEPIMEVPLGLGASFRRLPVFSVELLLVPPPEVDAPPLRWTLDVAAQTGWRLPFAVLLGQRGWFDRFPTTIDASSTVVHLPS